MVYLRTDDNPILLVITPLKQNAVVSEGTKTSVALNKTPMVWVSFEGAFNPAKNTELAYELIKRGDKDKSFDYVMKLDNDITSSDSFIDSMVQSLESHFDKAYAYCDFSFTGSINARFVNLEFNKQKLLIHNYISFNSVIRVKYLEEVGSFITDDKYFRLLDWCLWLRFLEYGYEGIRVSGVKFKAFAGKGSVSSGSAQDYQNKRNRVFNDFIANKKLI